MTTNKDIQARLIEFYSKQMFINVYMRAKKKAPTTIKRAPSVIFGVTAELHKSFSQHTLAIIELASTYNRTTSFFLRILLECITYLNIASILATSTTNTTWKCCLIAFIISTSTCFNDSVQLWAIS